MSDTSSAGGRRLPRLTPMSLRDPHEPHRTATELELLFDLVFVVGVGQAAASLHHAIVESADPAHHMSLGRTVLSYLLVFFAIWWAWMNWTWFSSAFDNDDIGQRIATFVQMFGVLVLAAGISDAFAGDFRLAVVGYAIMRFAIVVLWLRAAAGDPAVRRTALRYAAGITVVQFLWIGRLWLPETPGMIAFFVLAAAELAVPAWAERSGITTWHPHHIAERYGLFTIIVLGESVLAATLAIKQGMDHDQALSALLTVAVSGFVIVCAMWWLYFARHAHHFLTSNRYSFPWGYGHYFIFGSIAAVGTGLSVAVDYDSGEAAGLSAVLAGASVAVPVAVYLASVWFVHIRPHHPGLRHAAAYLTGMVLVLLTPLTPVPLPLVAAVMVGVVVAVELADRQVRSSGPAPGRSPEPPS